MLWNLLVPGYNPLTLDPKLSVATGVDPFSFTYISTNRTNADLTTYTFTAQSLGAVVTGGNTRYTVIGIGGAANTVFISTVTVGGLSASPVVDIGTSAPGIWIVDTSSLGTSANIVVTWNAAQIGCGIDVCRMVNPGSLTATDTDTQTTHSSGVTTFTLDIPTNGVGFAVLQIRETVLPTVTWTGTASPSEKTDADVDNGDAMSSAISTVTGASRTFIATSTDTTPLTHRGVAASWGP